MCLVSDTLVPYTDAKKNVSDTIKYVFIIVQAQPEWGWIGSG